MGSATSTSGGRPRRALRRSPTPIRGLAGSPAPLRPGDGEEPSPLQPRLFEPEPRPGGPEALLGGRSPDAALRAACPGWATSLGHEGSTTISTPPRPSLLSRMSTSVSPQDQARSVLPEPAVLRVLSSPTRPEAGLGRRPIDAGGNSHGPVLAAATRSQELAAREAARSAIEAVFGPCSDADWSAVQERVLQSSLRNGAAVEQARRDAPALSPRDALLRVGRAAAGAQEEPADPNAAQGLRGLGPASAGGLFGADPGGGQAVPTWPSPGPEEPRARTRPASRGAVARPAPWQQASSTGDRLATTAEEGGPERRGGQWGPSRRETPMHREVDGSFSSGHEYGPARTGGDWGPSAEEPRRVAGEPPRVAPGGGGDLALRLQDELNQLRGEVRRLQLVPPPPLDRAQAPGTAVHGLEHPPTGAGAWPDWAGSGPTSQSTRWSPCGAETQLRHCRFAPRGEGRRCPLRLWTLGTRTKARVPAQQPRGTPCGRRGRGCRSHPWSVWPTLQRRTPRRRPVSFWTAPLGEHSTRLAIARTPARRTRHSSSLSTFCRGAAGVLSRWASRLGTGIWELNSRRP